MRSSSSAALIRLGIHGSLVDYELFRTAASLLHIGCVLVLPTVGCLLGGYPLSWFPLFAQAPLCRLSPYFYTFIACLLSLLRHCNCPFPAQSGHLCHLDSQCPLSFLGLRHCCVGSGCLFMCHSESSVTHVSRFT